jgi:DNA polymerase elongation subunit (family B)
LIKANRELVCRAGILQAKKKYMMLVVDKEGKAIKEDSEDRLKTMGSDIKLSSTPAPIKAMLKNVVMAILNQRPRKEIDDIIMQFRNDMKAGAGLNLDVLDLATVNSVSKLEKYNLLHARKMETGMKATIPAGANAAINYNTVLKNLKIHDAKEITSGDKIKIVWLTPNPEGFKNMAFPSDTETIPEWFTAHYEVDRKQMEQKLVDQKLQNIFEALDWEVPTLQTVLTNSLLDF